MRNARPTAREWQEALKQGEKRQKGEPPKPPPPQAPAEEDIRQMQSRKTTATALILLVVPTQVMLEVFLLVNIPDYAFLLAAAAKVVTFLSTGIAYIRWVATADRNLEKIYGQDRYMRAGTFWLLLPWTVPPFNAINPVIPDEETHDALEPRAKGLRRPARPVAWVHHIRRGERRDQRDIHGGTKHPGSGNHRGSQLRIPLHQRHNLRDLHGPGHKGNNEARLIEKSHESRSDTRHLNYRAGTGMLGRWLGTRKNSSNTDTAADGYAGSPGARCGASRDANLAAVAREADSQEKV